jgi:hypothetical protein
MKMAEKEAKFLNDQFKPRKDVKFEIRPEGWNRKNWSS